MTRLTQVPPSRSSWAWGCLWGWRKRAQSIGVKVTAMTREKAMAIATVIPKLLKKRPTRPAMKAMGRKMTIRDRVVAITASMISFVPSMAA